MNALYRWVVPDSDEFRLAAEGAYLRLLRCVRDADAALAKAEAMLERWAARWS